MKSPGPQTLPEPLARALHLPNGARFVKCALQVNPFAYLARYGRRSPYRDEVSYNSAILDACEANGIEVIAVTNHYDVAQSRSLIEAARDRGIEAFAGFEAVSKEGVHLLCLFDPGTPESKLERIIGECGVHEEGAASPVGTLDSEALLERATKWGCVFIAAHVGLDGGILRQLKGQACIRTWRSPHLHACAIAGSTSDLEQGLRGILENTNPDYQREHPVAVVNASDISNPTDLANPASSCWIRMSSVTVEALRQAFLDPESRIRLATDAPPQPHSEILAIAWQGGFLDGVALHLNENLNILVGGRGAGKSTVIESIRAVLGLEARGDEARQTHEGVIRHVLRSGTTISLLVRSPHPSPAEYVIERTLPNPAVVRSKDGQVLDLAPRDVFPRAEVYGQHEIAEIARSKDKLTPLLHRFLDHDDDLARRKDAVRGQLRKTRQRLLETWADRGKVQERLQALPGIEETLRRYQAAGVEEQLREQTLVVREEQVLKAVSQRLTPFRDIATELRGEQPLDLAFLTPAALKDLPGHEILAAARGVLQAFGADIGAVTGELAGAIDRAEAGLRKVREKWDVRRHEARARYEKVLRDLQKSRIDGEEFIRLRQQLEELRPLAERETLLRRSEAELLESRRNLVAEWENLKAEEFRRLDSAAKRVTRKLEKRVRVHVSFASNRDPLVDLLKQKVGGRLSEAFNAIGEATELSLPALADACRLGGGEIARVVGGMPSAQADRIAAGPADLPLLIEELDLPPTTAIELDLASVGEPPAWKPLRELSTGQKATAVLLLLLLDADAPLVADQPEDDLDNRFIAEGVVPRIRDAKRQRQFIFSTHNANIPVLGDAELIVGLTPSGEASQGTAMVLREHAASIDAQPVRALVEELLEGGRQAFEMRRLKYGH